jgi:transmembrane sensor
VEALIARVLSGEASYFEKRKLERWRRASDQNEQLYQEFELTWKLTAPAEALSPPPSAEDIIAEANRRRPNVIPIRKQARPGTRVRPWMVAAASVAAILAASIVLIRLQTTPTQLYTTGMREAITIPLADGSVVRLAPNSELEVRGSAERSVRLDGTAFFAVATDSTKPFVVRTDAGRAEVLGTRFELRAENDSVRLVVVEGRVRLSGDGERVVVSEGEVPSVPEISSVWELIDWPDGLLIFQATPLAQVVDEVGAHFGIPFAVGDTMLARRTVTAWFEDESFEEVVTTVCQVIGAACTIGNTVEVTR